ncbi:GNAT family N-acetyltransferase [Cellulomonas timonensis]|uniref:GNAT family N-acetyltransferase n=1 Tax=Cellulomonas timonensis TaxID=1689271 RepID=UPI00083518FE|nr:GNAT family N-acetyltransferase [Cellulomonas timonensis]
MDITTARDLGFAPATVDDVHWDALTQDAFYSSARWVRYCAGAAAGRTGLLLAGEPSRPRAGAVVTEVESAAAGLYDWNTLLAERGLPALPGHGAMIGVLQGYQGRLVSAPASGPEDVAMLVDQLREAAAVVGEASGGGASQAATVGMYLDTDGVRRALAAGVDGIPVLLELDASIDVCGGWDAWLGTLTSKRRVAVRGERRRFREAGYVVEDSTLAERVAVLGPLARATGGKYGTVQDVESYESLLRAHIEGMGAEARVLTCARDGVVTGFCLYYRWNGTVHLRWAGFDYDRLAPGAAEYFNLVYYELIERSAVSGDRRLHAGIKASEAKALRGARLQPSWLLDFGAERVLAGAAADARAHNAAALARALANPRTAGAIDPEEWSGFC